jgi:hypothetical protein
MRGTDGGKYPFLVKPKDDLRKDARLMEFNSIINKLLKKDAETSRRQLCMYLIMLLLISRYPDVFRRSVERRTWDCGVGTEHESLARYNL